MLAPASFSVFGGRRGSVGLGFGDVAVRHELRDTVTGFARMCAELLLLLDNNCGGWTLHRNIVKKSDVPDFPNVPLIAAAGLPWCGERDMMY